MTLDQLAVGDHAIIVQVGGEGLLRRRLLDMGLIPGTHIHVRKKAPMGDPVEYGLRGYVLSLRLEEAARIEVTHPKEVDHESDSTGRQPELRENDTVQCDHREQSACGKLSRRDRREKRRGRKAR